MLSQHILAPGVAPLQVLRALHARGGRTLAVLSTGDEDAAAFFVASLAVAAAERPGHHALVIDADPTVPRLDQAFGIGRGPGLMDHLARALPLRRMLVRPGLARLAVLPAGHAPERADEILGSLRTARFVAAVRARYTDRLVLFDAPDLARARVTAGIVSFVDAVLVVATDGAARAEALAAGLRLVGSDRLLGVLTLDDAAPRLHPATSWSRRLAGAIARAAAPSDRHGEA